MTTPGGMGVLNSLKNKMQHLRDELEKYKDLYDEKCVELEEEKQKRSEVRENFDLILHRKIQTSTLNDCMKERLWRQKIEQIKKANLVFRSKESKKYLC